MRMRIGYACICTLDETTKIKTCILRNANEERLTSLIQHNLNALLRILSYNHEHDIRMFRISSDIIPFGSSPANTLDWHHMFADSLYHIGNLIKAYDMRVSFHPGQYTLLNSPRDDVTHRSILDLQYHASFLDALGLDSSHKMILHVGGVYGDKDAAKQRFCDVYEHLNDQVKKRLVIENDDRYYHIEDVLTLSEKVHVPIVFDNLHHHILSPDTKMEDRAWINYVKRTWSSFDGIQKMHYSEQDPTRQKGAHAQQVDVNVFLAFVKLLNRNDIDIMLEVKDKNISALACVEALKNAGFIV